MPAVVIQEVIQVYIKGRDVSPDKGRARRLRDTRCLEVEVDGILIAVAINIQAAREDRGRSRAGCRCAYLCPVLTLDVQGYASHIEVAIISYSDLILPDLIDIDRSRRAVWTATSTMDKVTLV